MDIKSQIQKDRVEALRNKQPERKGTLDYILGEIQKKEKDLNAKGDIATAIITAHLKSLREFILQHGGDRPEEAKRYQAEIEMLEPYLPTQLTDEQLRTEIHRIHHQEEESRKGIIMKILKERFGAAVDGKRAAAILDELGIK